MPRFSHPGPNQSPLPGPSQARIEAVQDSAQSPAGAIGTLYKFHHSPHVKARKKHPATGDATNDIVGKPVAWGRPNRPVLPEEEQVLPEQAALLMKMKADAIRGEAIGGMRRKDALAREIEATGEAIRTLQETIARLRTELSPTRPAGPVSPDS
ncbi:hypothetical protein [Noviherbaspirillum sp.]|uniref:hypothetical protein n=1 Tax=Noviherbaspirillum sp. TaxID=1926288 RepID=UPI002FE323D9